MKGTKILFASTDIVIIYLKKCVYLKFAQKSSLADASKSCTSLNMTLLTIENLTSIQTFQPLLKSDTKYNISSLCHIMTKYLDLKQKSFWTSASSEGQNCGIERTFAWCTSGAIVDEKYVNDAQLWLNAPNGSETTANCVALGLSSSETSAQLSLAACADSKSFMCQVLIFAMKLKADDSNFFLQPKCESGTCPSNCVKDVTINIFSNVEHF